MTDSFHGAKIAILVGNHVVTILRDDRPDISWPDTWDLPGGGREGAETGEETVRRELMEELGLILPQSAITWMLRETVVDRNVWFFAAEWPDFDSDAVTFGDEGQEWRLVSVEWFLAQEKAVPNLQRRLRLYLESRDALKLPHDRRSDTL